MLASGEVFTWAIPLGALLVAIATLLFTVKEMRHRARVDYVDELEHRIAECEDDRKDMHKKLNDLQRENLELMRRLMRLEDP